MRTRGPGAHRTGRVRTGREYVRVREKGERRVEGSECGSVGADVADAAGGVCGSTGVKGDFAISIHKAVFIISLAGTAYLLGSE